MIYKHLRDKIEDSHASINKITMIAMEASSSRYEESNSEIMEEFYEEGLEVVCNTLDWKNDDKTIEMVESELEEVPLAHLMFKNNKGGFLAEVLTPLHVRFSFVEGTDKPSSWGYNNSVHSIEWVYADTIDELSDKVIEAGKKHFEEDMKVFLEKGNE
jgi:histidyl-tRNA synthetase